jgi:thioredoxin-like negative regulator of GroEL
MPSGVLRNLGKRLQGVTPSPVQALPVRTPLPAVTAQAGFTPTPRGALSVEEARRNVGSSPNDPYARLDLAIAYGEAGEAALALAELDKAMDVAGDDMRFFVKAGQKLAERSDWLSAARVYIRLAQMYPVSEPVPENILNAFHEAVYEASKQDKAKMYISFETLDQVDQLLRYVAEARYTFYNGDPRQAQKLLDDLQTIKKDFTEARLLQAELNAKQGQTDSARNLLTALLDDKTIADWIRAEANLILSQLP